MKKIFMLFAAMAVTVATMAANQPVGNKNKQKAPKQEQLSEWQKAAAAWGGKAQAAKSNSLLQGSIVLEPVTPDLSNNTLPSFTSLNLPYSGEVAWAPTGTIKVPAMGYSTAAAMCFTFNVSENRNLVAKFLTANYTITLNASQRQAALSVVAALILPGAWSRSRPMPIVDTASMVGCKSA